MNPVHIVALIARVFALLLFFSTAREIFSAIWVIDDPVHTKDLIALYLTCAASMATSALFWFFPSTIAKRIYAPPEAEVSHKSLQSDELYMLGIILLGFYFIYYAVTDAIYWSSLVFFNSRELIASPIMTIENKAAMLATAVEFCVSLYLILGARRLTSILRGATK